MKHTNCEGRANGTKGQREIILDELIGLAPFTIEGRKQVISLINTIAEQYGFARGTHVDTILLLLEERGYLRIARPQDRAHQVHEWGDDDVFHITVPSKEVKAGELEIINPANVSPCKYSVGQEIIIARPGGSPEFGMVGLVKDIEYRVVYVVRAYDPIDGYTLELNVPERDVLRSMDDVRRELNG